MKKILIIVIIVIIVLAIFLITRSKKDYKRDDYKRSSHNEHKEKSHNTYKSKDTFEVKGFSKGYDGDFNKKAVEAANKKYSKVTLNTKYSVKGSSNIQGATNCEYVRDIDGDTLVAKVNGKNETIRFYGIDTPEDVNPRIHCIEPYSIQAKDFVESKLKSGQTIKILFNDEKGKYGRSVGTIYYKNNNKWYSLNEALVANGLARVAYLNQNNKTINTNDLYTAQDNARSQKLNIWSIDGYTTRYGFNLAIFK